MPFYRHGRNCKCKNCKKNKLKDKKDLRFVKTLFLLALALLIVVG